MRGFVLADLVEDADVLVRDETAGLEARAVERIFDVLEGEREDEDVDDLLRQVLAEGFLRGHGEHHRGAGEGAELERRALEELAAVGNEDVRDLGIDAAQKVLRVHCAVLLRSATSP